jgi:hypothetical protein
MLARIEGAHGEILSTGLSNGIEGSGRLKRGNALEPSGVENFHAVTGRLSLDEGKKILLGR